MMKFNSITLGCKVNAYESDFIYSLFKKKGYVFDSENFDICVVNTCTVTNMADKKSRQVIHRIRRENPSSVLVVCGCYCENMHKENREEEIDADIVIGNKDKSKIVDYVEEYLEKREKNVKFYDIRHASFEDMEIEETTSHTRAYVKIEDGCNNFCTYCVIPFTRGCVRSKEHERVIEEITKLVNNGYKEIVLTGIHTGAYNDEGYDFADLLSDLIKIDNLYRIRISSVEINELNDRVLELFKNSDKIAKHFHIPLQSGSERILKEMNRKYNKAFFLDRVNKIRSINENVNLTTDVIVGFPTETYEEHLESLEFIKEIGFSKVHTFPYSDRDGTVASKKPNKVSPIDKKKRVNELLNLSIELENNYYKKFYGKKVDVLFEEYKEGYSYGHTSNFIKVKVKENIPSNEIRSVLLNEENICIERVV